MARTGQCIRIVFTALAVTAGALTILPDEARLQPAGGPALIDPDQGWDAATRKAFYHQSQHSKIVPYWWFMALRMRNGTAPFHDRDNLAKYGFIADPFTAGPDVLPIGFSITDAPQPDPTKGSEADFHCSVEAGGQARPVWLSQLGLTCAGCHTGQLNYKGVPYLVEGGASMHYNADFFSDVILAMAETMNDPVRFAAFAQRVVPHEPLLPAAAPPVAQAGELMKCVSKWLTELTTPNRALAAKGQPIISVPWGPGRLDAFGRALNTGFVNNTGPANAHMINAPVSFPHIWGAWRYDWVQWNASIQNPMGRNVAQSLGLRAGVKFPTPAWGVETTVDTVALQSLENMVRLLKAPRWPEAVFGKPDAALAGQGRGLYDRKCAGCHTPETVRAGDAFTKFDQHYNMDARSVIGLKVVGTDPLMAYNFYERIMLRPELAMDGGKPAPVLRPVSAAMAVQWLTDEVMRLKPWNGAPPTPNQWRAPLAYLARPNAGVWATPPFLHNGSVRSIYELLLPVEKRSKRFCAGKLEYDPRQLGYIDECGLTPNGLEAALDTSLPGNANTGHEFRAFDRFGKPMSAAVCAAFETGGGGVDRSHGHYDGILGCELTEPERLALLEYLKTCPADDPNLICDTAEPKRVPTSR
jgi:hypothetical protein